MDNFTKSVILSGLLCISGQSFSQNSKELTPGYYVVVGAYAKTRENVAQNYVEVLRLKGLQSMYGFNSKRNLYFVYLKYFDNLKDALDEMKETRKQSDFRDAWVRVVSGDIKVLPPTPVAEKAEVPAPENAVALKPEIHVMEKPVEDPVAGQHPEIVVTENPPIVQYPVMTLGNTEVFLSLYNARNSRIVDGQVNVVDTDRARLITSVKGNEYLVLPDPKSKSGQLTLICEAFGYRKIQQEINYPLPLADTVKSYIDLMGTTLVINFDLVRYQKGDIGTLYNVYFFNDAALMLPESQYELNSLLQLMNENSRYRIRLHGHTNGNYTGKIFTAGPEKNLFSLEGAKQGMGSAKDLSRGRAEVIKEFLVSNGVDPSRMEIKAWAGKRPIFDKNGANAKKNVRVEVEILEE